MSFLSKKKQSMTPANIEIYRTCRTRFKKSFKHAEYELFCLGALTAVECLNQCLPEGTKSPEDLKEAEMLLDILCKSVPAAAFIKRNVKSDTGYSWNDGLSGDTAAVRIMMEEAFITSCNRIAEGLNTDCQKTALEYMKIVTAIVLPPPEKIEPAVKKINKEKKPIKA